MGGSESRDLKNLRRDRATAEAELARLEAAEKRVLRIPTEADVRAGIDGRVRRALRVIRSAGCEANSVPRGRSKATRPRSPTARA